MTYKSYDEILREEAVKFRKEAIASLEARKERFVERILQSALFKMREEGVEKVVFTPNPAKDEPERIDVGYSLESGNVDFDKIMSYAHPALCQEYLLTQAAL